MSINATLLVVKGSGSSAEGLRYESKFVSLSLKDEKDKSVGKAILDLADCALDKKPRELSLTLKKAKPPTLLLNIFCEIVQVDDKKVVTDESGQVNLVTATDLSASDGTEDGGIDDSELEASESDSAPKKEKRRSILGLPSPFASKDKARDKALKREDSLSEGKDKPKLSREESAKEGRSSRRLKREDSAVKDKTHHSAPSSSVPTDTAAREKESSELHVRETSKRKRKEEEQTGPAAADPEATERFVQLEERLGRLDAELSSTKIALSTVETNNSRLAERLKRETERADAATERCLAAESTARLRDQEISRLTETSALGTATAAEGLAAAKASLAAMEKTLAVKDSLLAEVHGKLSAIESAFDKQKTELQSVLQSEVRSAGVEKELKTAVASAQIQITDLQAQLAAASQARNRLELAAQTGAATAAANEASLASRIKVVEAELSDLKEKQRVDSVERELAFAASLQENTAVLNAQLAAAQAKIVEREAEIAQISSTLKGTEESSAEQQTAAAFHVNAIQAELADLKDKLRISLTEKQALEAALQENAAAANVQLSSARSKIVEQEVAISQLSSKLKSTEDSAADQQAALEEAKLLALSLQEAQTQQASADESRNSHIRALEMQVTDLDQKQTLAASLQEEVVALKSQLSAARVELADREAQVSEIASKFEEAKVTAIELKHDSNISKQLNASLRADLDHAGTQISRLESELQARVSQVQKLESEVREGAEQRAQAEFTHAASLHQKAQELAAAQESLEKLEDARAAELSGEEALRQANAELAAANQRGAQQLSKLQAELESAKQGSVQSHERLRVQEEELVALRRRVGETQASAALELEIASQRQTIESLTAQIASSASISAEKVSALEADLHAATQTRSQLEATVQAHRASGLRCEELESSLSSLRAELDVAKVSASHAASTSTEPLLTEIAALKAALSVKQAEQTALEGRASTAENSLNSMSVREKQLQDHIKHLFLEIERLKLSLAESREQADAQGAELTELTRRLADSSAAQMRADAKWDEGQSSIKEKELLLQAELDSANSRAESAASRASTLEADLVSTRAELVHIQSRLTDQEEHAAALQDAHFSREASLAQRICGLESDLSTAASARESALQQQQSLRRQVEQLEVELQTSKEASQLSLRHVDELERQKTQQLEAIQGAEQSSQASVRELAQLRAALAEAKRQTSDARSELDSRLRELETAKDFAGKLQQQHDLDAIALTSANISLRDLEQLMASRERDEVGHGLTTQQLLLDLEVAKEKILAAHKQDATMREQLETMSAKEATQSALISQLAAQAVLARTSRADEQAVLEEHQRVKQELDIAQRLVESTSEELERTQQKLAEAVEALAQSRSDSETVALESQNSSLQTTLKEIEKERQQESVAAAAELKLALAATEAERQVRLDEQERLIIKLGQSTQQIASLQAEVERSKQSSADEREEIAELKRKLGKLSTELAEQQPRADLHTPELDLSEPRSTAAVLTRLLPSLLKIATPTTAQSLDPRLRAFADTLFSFDEAFVPAESSESDSGSESDSIDSTSSDSGEHHDIGPEYAEALELVCDTLEGKALGVCHWSTSAIWLGQVSLLRDEVVTFFFQGRFPLSGKLGARSSRASSDPAAASPGGGVVYFGAFSCNYFQGLALTSICSVAFLERLQGNLMACFRDRMRSKLEKKYLSLLVHPHTRDARPVIRFVAAVCQQCLQVGLAAVLVDQLLVNLFGVINALTVNSLLTCAFPHSVIDFDTVF